MMVQMLAGFAEFTIIDEAAVVTRIFRLYTRDRIGIRAIANTLNNAGHRTKSGKPWSGAAVLTILRNRVHLGEVFHRDQWHRGAQHHPPIISPELFTDAEQVLLARSGDHVHRVPVRHPGPHRPRQNRSLDRPLLTAFENAAMPEPPAPPRRGPQPQGHRASQPPRRTRAAHRRNPSHNPTHHRTPRRPAPPHPHPGQHRGTRRSAGTPPGHDREDRRGQPGQHHPDLPRPGNRRPGPGRRNGNIGREGSYIAWIGAPGRSRTCNRRRRRPVPCPLGHRGVELLVRCPRRGSTRVSDLRGPSYAISATGACGGCRIRTRATLARRPPFSRRLPYLARPILLTREMLHLVSFPLGGGRAIRTRAGRSARTTD